MHYLLRELTTHYLGGYLLTTTHYSLRATQASEDAEAMRPLHLAAQAGDLTGVHLLLKAAY